jgi:hypothetical protein
MHGGGNLNLKPGDTDKNLAKTTKRAKNGREMGLNRSCASRDAEPGTELLHTKGFGQEQTKRTGKGDGERVFEVGRSRGWFDADSSRL